MNLPTERCVFQVMGVTTTGTPTVRLIITLGMGLLGTSLPAVRSQNRKIDKDGVGHVYRDYFRNALIQIIVRYVYKLHIAHRVFLPCKGIRRNRRPMEYAGKCGSAFT